MFINLSLAFLPKKKKEPADKYMFEYKRIKDLFICYYEKVSIEETQLSILKFEILLLISSVIVYLL